MALTITFIGNNFSGTGGSPITFTGQAIGTADSTRIVAIGITAGLLAATVTNVQLGSINMIQAKNAAISTLNDIIDIWYLPFPTGTNADVKLTFSSAPTQVGIAVYTVTSLGDFASANTGSVALGTSLTASLTVPSGGVTLTTALIDSGAAGTITTTNLVLDSSNGIVFATSTMVYGHDSIHTGGATFGFGWTTSANAAISMATFGQLSIVDLSNITAQHLRATEVVAY